MSITFTDKEWEQIESLKQQGLNLLKKAENIERQIIIRERAKQYEEENKTLNSPQTKSQDNKKKTCEDKEGVYKCQVCIDTILGIPDSEGNMVEFCGCGLRSEIYNYEEEK